MLDACTHKQILLLIHLVKSHSVEICKIFTLALNSFISFSVLKNYPSVLHITFNRSILTQIIFIFYRIIFTVDLLCILSMEI